MPGKSGELVHSKRLSHPPRFWLIEVLTFFKTPLLATQAWHLWRAQAQLPICSFAFNSLVSWAKVTNGRQWMLRKTVFSPCLLKHPNCPRVTTAGRLSQNCKCAGSYCCGYCFGLGGNGLATQRQVFTSLCGILGAGAGSHIIYDLPVFTGEGQWTWVSAFIFDECGRGRRPRDVSEKRGAKEKRC